MRQGEAATNGRAQRLVIVATYNERQNLSTLVESIMTSQPHLDLLIVDDNSPDGTGQLADMLSQKHPGIQVLHRRAKNGLASALECGFRWGLERDYELFINIDGDLSHDPKEIPRLVALVRQADLAIGSRYLNGIRVINWSPRRLFISLAAAQYVRLVTGMPFADPTSGFRCFRREPLASILETPVLSRGYSFHIECLHRVWRAGGRVVEVPILYADRVNGETKMNFRIVWEALWITCRLLCQNHFRRRPTRLRATWAAEFDEIELVGYGERKHFNVVEIAPLGTRFESEAKTD